jgi:hypothetical protein
MSTKARDDKQLWHRTVTGLRSELAGISPEERNWITARLGEVVRLQERLHALFLGADGEQMCRSCRGLCCERGRNHPTLVNLLGYLLEERDPPAPDFTLTCPFLGPRGCRIEIGRRPFNCVTFVCEGVEQRLDEAGRESFYALEKELRREYETFAKRFAGAGLRGLLIRAERLGDGPLLRPLPESL